ncbi:MAG: two-component regulator propeller domain-containing protein [Bacteroidota bacterium]
MRHPAPSRLALLVLLLAGAPSALAQTAGWQAYPAYNEVGAIAGGPDGVWAATRAGVLFYGVPDGEIVTYTTVNGLRGGAVGAMDVDASGMLWIGYVDGLFERLDPVTGEVTPFFAVARADQYPSRGVRRIRAIGDLLYLATDFGIVVFDAALGQVVDSYARLGDLEAGTPVNDVIEAPLADGAPGLWAATAGGIYTAPRDGTNLQTPSAWTRDTGLDGEMFSLAQFDGAVYVGGGPDGVRDVYRRGDEGDWRRVLFTNQPLIELRRIGESLFALSQFFAFEIRPGQPYVTYFAPEADVLRGIAAGPDGGVWLGDGAVGLFRAPSQEPVDNRIEFSAEPVSFPGPGTNNIAALDVGADGVLWVATPRLEVNPAATINRLDGGEWTVFETTDLDLDISRAPFEAATVGPDGTFYAGSTGRGMTVFTPDGSVSTYSSANSSLIGSSDDPTYQVVRELAFEGGIRWVSNLSATPLHVFDEDGNWTALAYPTRGDRIPATADIFQIAIDDFGNKWLGLGDRGLGVWDTGEDPTDPSDDQALYFSGSPTSGQGLPDPRVRDVVIDREGRVWIGTERGLAFVFSPGSAFSGSRDLVQPQWARTEDGTSFLLRDVAVNDLEVDPAGQIWVATTTGAFLLNAEGNGVVREITSADSPLPSDDILSIAVDPTSGLVFMATSEGLFSVPGDATIREPASEALRVSPSPFRPAEADGVVVSGLAAPTSQIRVLTVSGEVVHEADVTGGSFRWDGRDIRTGRPASSGVYIVAAAGDDGSTLFGKVAILR